MRAVRWVLGLLNWALFLGEPPWRHEPSRDWEWECLCAALDELGLPYEEDTR